MCVRNILNCITERPEGLLEAEAAREENRDGVDEVAREGVFDGVALPLTPSRFVLERGSTRVVGERVGRGLGWAYGVLQTN